MTSPTSRLLDESRSLRHETALLCTAMDRLGAKVDELLNLLGIAPVTEGWSSCPSR